MMKTLKLASDIYDIEAIKRACDAYSQISSISVASQERAYALTFDDCKYDEERTVLEFENYLIGMENK